MCTISMEICTYCHGNMSYIPTSMEACNQQLGNVYHLHGKMSPSLRYGQRSQNCHYHDSIY